MDAIIDLLIAALFIAVPAIFKAVGKKLEKSGSDKTGNFKKIAEALGEEQGDRRVLEDRSFPEIVPEVVEVSAPTVDSVLDRPYVSTDRQTSVTARPEHIRPTNAKPAVPVEDEQEKRGEKIDPRKLVIYSEIMKPKF